MSPLLTAHLWMTQPCSRIPSGWALCWPWGGEDGRRPCQWGLVLSWEGGEPPRASRTSTQGPRAARCGGQGWEEGLRAGWPPPAPCKRPCSVAPGPSVATVTPPILRNSYSTGLESFWLLAARMCLSHGHSQKIGLREGAGFRTQCGQGRAGNTSREWVAGQWSCQQEDGHPGLGSVLEASL